MSRPGSGRRPTPVRTGHCGCQEPRGHSPAAGHPTALGPAARSGAGTGGGVRQLTAVRRSAHRLEEHPASRLDSAWIPLAPGCRRSPRSEDLESAFTRWALDAPLLLVRRDHGPWTAPAGVSFRQWLRLGRGVIPDRRPPTTDDLDYHLTTLFPQVRPRGHLEVRYIDAQPGGWWTVPPAVIAALLDDETAADQARAACRATEGRWQDAARVGMDDAELGHGGDPVAGDRRDGATGNAGPHLVGRAGGGIPGAVDGQGPMSGRRSAGRRDGPVECAQQRKPGG